MRTHCRTIPYHFLVADECSEATVSLPGFRLTSVLFIPVSLGCGVGAHTKQDIVVDPLSSQPTSLQLWRQRALFSRVASGMFAGMINLRLLLGQFSMANTAIELKSRVSPGRVLAQRARSSEISLQAFCAMNPHRLFLKSIWESSARTTPTNAPIRHDQQAAHSGNLGPPRRENTRSGKRTFSFAISHRLRTNSDLRLARSSG
eukprot:GEMP01005798.1.p1 GENE.GEMP01005798.1~~GEMP01005798.1.p1  ORF type:complete len:203 (+),score=29.98 GEMP01005798.1:2657-3265(+)